jgi:uncharacterized protein (UPF0276 family)
MNTKRVDAAIPPRAGAGLKPEHYHAILEQNPAIGFFEIHAENYMGEGGPPHRYLEAIRARYPLSLHGVGLSIGGSRGLDKDHLRRLTALIERYQPGLVSEHLAWSTHDVGFLNDLLPVPYTKETLARVCEHIDEVQTALGRRMLLENPSVYVLFEESVIPETEFLREIAERTGCGLLLDVNNVEVSATNAGYDAKAYIDSFPVEYVGEIHLAGSTEAKDDHGVRMLIDAHGSPVEPPVWTLFQLLLHRTGPKPALIEWDNDVPEWPELHAEAMKAESALRKAAALWNLPTQFGPAENVAFTR